MYNTITVPVCAVVRGPRAVAGAVRAARGVRGGVAGVFGAVAAQRRARGRLRPGQGHQAARHALPARLIAIASLLLHHRVVAQTSTPHRHATCPTNEVCH